MHDVYATICNQLKKAGVKNNNMSNKKMSHNTISSYLINNCLRKKT